MSVSAFVADIPGSCHAWPVGADSSAGDLLVNVRCTGPAPYSISLARAMSTVAPETADGVGAAAPGLLTVQGPTQPVERRVSSLECDAELQECSGMQTSGRVRDASVVQVIVVY